MAASKKHYVAAAAIILAEYKYALSFLGYPSQAAIRRIAEKLATEFGQDNPRFDREKFMKAALGE